MLFGTTIKDKHANPVVESGMEGRISILVQPKATAIPTTMTPSLVAIMENLGVDVRVEEIEATFMEE
jgi:hypothetical protein